MYQKHRVIAMQCTATRQPHGMSLIESLVALVLTSTLFLSLIKLQINVLSNTKRTYHQEMTIRAQLSLSESLKSCLGETNCQQFEIQKWHKELALGIKEYSS